MAGNFSTILHLRDRLPKIAPRINLELGRFFISTEEFNARVNEICCELWRIKKFAKFAVGNFRKLKERHLEHGDIQIFVDFLSVFLEKEMVSPKSMFKKACRQYPFEFLLIFGLCRE